MADPISIRFPDELRAKLAARAHAEHRNLSAQVIHIVEQALAKDLAPVDASYVPGIRRQPRPDPKPAPKQKPGRRR